MKKKWVLYLILTFSILLNSCQNTNNQNKSLNDDFINAFKELEILKATSELGSISDSIYNNEVERIFSKNKITQEDYEAELNYYINNLSEFENIVKETMRRHEKSMNFK